MSDEATLQAGVEYVLSAHRANQFFPGTTAFMLSAVCMATRAGRTDSEMPTDLLTTLKALDGYIGVLFSGYSDDQDYQQALDSIEYIVKNF